METAAPSYADIATQHTVDVIENCQLATDTFRLRFACAEIARCIIPGQFLMLRLSNFDDPLIGRPFAMYDVVSLSGDGAGAVDVVYLVAGKLTSRLRSLQPGQRIDVLGHWATVSQLNRLGT